MAGLTQILIVQSLRLPGLCLLREPILDLSSILPPFDLPVVPDEFGFAFANSGEEGVQGLSLPVPWKWDYVLLFAPVWGHGQRFDFVGSVFTFTSHVKINLNPKKPCVFSRRNSLRRSFMSSIQIRRTDRNSNGLKLS